MVTEDGRVFRGGGQRAVDAGCVQGLDPSRRRHRTAGRRRLQKGHAVVVVIECHEQTIPLGPLAHPAIAATAGVPGVIGASASALPALEDALSDRLTGKSLILLFDEAHNLDPEVGHALLNGVQDVGRTAPLVLVLAGTPDFVQRPRTARCCGWCCRTPPPPGGSVPRVPDVSPGSGAPSTAPARRSRTAGAFRAGNAGRGCRSSPGSTNVRRSVPPPRPTGVTFLAGRRGAPGQRLRKWGFRSFRKRTTAESPARSEAANARSGRAACCRGSHPRDRRDRRGACGRVVSCSAAASRSGSRPSPRSAIWTPTMWTRRRGSGGW